MAFPLIPLGIGLGLGALGGGLASGFGSSSNSNSSSGQGNALTGYGPDNQQLSRYTPEQQKLLNTLIGQIQGMNPSFEGYANKARSDFKTDTIPSILQRFSANSSNKNSSGLQGALGSAASELDLGLNALRSQYDLASRGQLLQGALQPSFENVFTPQSSGFLGSLASNPAVGNFLGGQLSSWLGSGVGQAAGSAVGQGAASTLASSVGSSVLPALGVGAGGAGLGLLLAYLINKNR